MSKKILISRISQFPATSETGKVAEYGISLSDAPMENVTIKFTSSNTAEGRVQNSIITFTPQNWDQPQSLYIQGVDDYLDDGTVAYSVTGKVITDDLTYNRASVPVISLVNLDDGMDKPMYIRGADDPDLDMVDYLKGQNGDDRIYGGYGQDNLKGGRGNDRIYGEQDDDLLFGEEGNDKLYGGYDDDKLDGGVGNDQLFGEQGLDTLLGGDGNDVLDGGIEADSMVGGSGNDTYYVDNAGDKVIDNGSASDVDTVIVTQSITYTLGANIENATTTATGDSNITGNTLNNGLTGNDAKNILDGGSGNDSLAGGGGSDSLLGGAGNDEIAGGTGNDTMIGGAGVDCADFEAAGGAEAINLLAGTATGSDGTDKLVDFENICSGKGNDSLTGNTVDNDITAGAGNDKVDAGAGNDSLAGCVYGANGGQGEKDALTGGSGADLFQLGWSGGCFYNDGSTSNAGRGDYALITDFTVGMDRLQLDGVASNYYIGASGVTGVSGQGLWLEQGATDELIAIIQGNVTININNTVNVAYFV